MKAPLELWLVRHGETTYSASKRVAGWSDPPLTENGRNQAEALRPVIDGQQFAGVWSSDLQRAAESARLAWGEPRTDRRLRECDFGALEGCTYEEADTTYGEVFRDFRDFQAPDGESHAALRSRLQDFVGSLEPGRHLLFVHGGVIRVLTQDLGVDRFVPTGSLLGLDWVAQEVLFVREPGNAGPED
jgi:probable phosphoglycerate mutase